MRHTLLATAVGAVVLACYPAIAADVIVPDNQVQTAPEVGPLVSGYLGLYAGASIPTASGDINCCRPYNTVLTFGATGAANFWLGQMLSLQFSARGEGTTPYNLVLGSDQKEARMGGAFGAHLAWRDPSSHTMGVFAALTGSNNWYVGDTHLGMMGGVEAQKYFGDTTLYAQIGYGDQFRPGDEMFGQYWFARGVVRHFLNPNMLVSGEISFASGQSTLSSSDLDILGWGLTIERRHDGSAFSIFGEYSGDLISGFRGTIIQHAFLAGVKLNFGQETMLENDRQGATFDLPKFYRAMPGSCWAVGC